MGRGERVATEENRDEMGRGGGRGRSLTHAGQVVGE